MSGFLLHGKRFAESFFLHNLFGLGRTKVTIIVTGPSNIEGGL
jgi:hypothetical protein